MVLLKTWIGIALAITMSFITGLFLITALNVKRTGGFTFPPLRFFQAYLDYHFNKDEVPLEGIFEVMSKNDDLRFSLLNLAPINEKRLSIIGLAIHFGPFGTLGSSTLPNSLIEELEEVSGRRIMVLRQLSNHSLDLPSKNEVKRTRGIILEAFNSTTRLRDCSTSFFQKESGGYCVTAIRIDCYCIILLSCPGYSVEDLPPEWLPIFSEIISKHGLIPIFIVDAHNSIDSSSWITSEPEVSRFVDLVEEVVENLKRAPREELKIGFKRFKAKSFQEDEIGPGGISTLVLNIGGRNHAIVVIDGNNMIKSLRDYLVKDLKDSLGLSALEIITTDTHILTGLRRARKGYFPVGSKTEKGLLLKTCKELVAEAIQTLSPCYVEVYVGEAKGVKVTGRIFEVLEDFIEYSKKAIIASIILLISSTGLLLSLIQILS